MARKKLQSATDQRKFTMVYNDFLESDLLNAKEKLLFIILKKFANAEGKCFPSHKKLSKLCGMSKPTIISLLKQLEEKEILRIENRTSEEKGKESNLYTLYDFADMWIKRESLKEATDQSNTSQSSQTSHFDNSDNTISELKSQDTYSLFNRNMLEEIYDYDILKQDCPEQIGLFDSLLELILEVLNSTKKTERINQEDKPIDIVKSRFLKLNYMHLIYVVDEISKQTKEIKNIKAYQLTSLFNAYTTMDLHYTNRVQHDMNK